MNNTAFEDEKLSNKMMKVAIKIIQDRVENSKSDRMNVANLAKQCEVSRAWIYKNFGATNEKIILTAIDILAPTLTASIRAPEVWRSAGVAGWFGETMKSFELTLRQVHEDPAIFHFYITHRLQSTEIGRHLAHHENRFISHVVRRQVELSNNTLDVKATTLVAEYLAAVRTGFIFKWLSSPQTSLEEKTNELRGLAHFLSLASKM
jgi:cell division inhibitor SulA